MSGFKGRERETRSWAQTEKIRGFCSGGHGLACANRLWWMPVLIATVLVTSILLEQYCWLWSVHQPVHPKGSILSWLVHFLPTHLFTFNYQIFCFPLTTGKCLLHLWGLQQPLFCGSFINWSLWLSWFPRQLSQLPRSPFKGVKLWQ